MTMTLDDAIKTLTSTYQSLDNVARGLVVDAGELISAMEKADPASEEYLVMTYLAKYNVAVPSEKKIEVQPTEE